ncbi:hypothetical protein DEO72_LG1g2672 [Vigna unguiculata]|uniref:Uncharacterized protein n=1 Tax=Vigna unguiculata TaxID=3917 RepID=A0A4D6KR25_VIGUN|nr:hypothetical protein DEO72_LG1g2672 [Vigna unguiculata]
MQIPCTIAIAWRVEPRRQAPYENPVSFPTDQKQPRSQKMLIRAKTPMCRLAARYAPPGGSFSRNPE